MVRDAPIGAPHHEGCDSVIAAAHLVLGVAARGALQLGLIFALGEAFGLFGLLGGGLRRGRLS